MTAPAVLATGYLAAPVGGDEARRAAEEELSKGIYHQNDPGPIERAVERALEWLDDLLSRAVGATPGGAMGVLVLFALVAALVAVVLWRTGPLRRGARTGPAAVELSGDLTADEHRRRADAHAAEGRFAEAVRERMRAIVRELESRGVLDPRPGRTADEIAREAGALVPVVASDLRTAASVFDEVWYGGRPATAQADAAIRQADQRLRQAQLSVAGPPVPGVSGYQVPR